MTFAKGLHRVSDKRNTYKVTAYVDTDLSLCDFLDRLAVAKGIPGLWKLESVEPCVEKAPITLGWFHPGAFDGKPEGGQ